MINDLQNRLEPMWTLILHLPNWQRKEIQTFRIRSHAEQYQQQFNRLTGHRFSTEIIWSSPDVDSTPEHNRVLRPDAFIYQCSNSLIELRQQQ